MNMEDVKKTLELLHNLDYKTLFGTLVCYERPEYLDDKEHLEKLYNFYMDFDYFTGLMNIDELEELYEDYGDDEEDDEDED